MSTIDSEMSPEEQAATNSELRQRLDTILPPVDEDNHMTEALIPDGEGCYVVRRVGDDQENSRFRIFHWDSMDKPGRLASGDENYVFSEAGELVSEQSVDLPPAPDTAGKILELIKENPGAVKTGGAGEFHGSVD
ncbi:MAG: hypothetical protein WD846_02420 [Patescibacteria group bacterium]